MNEKNRLKHAAEIWRMIVQKAEDKREVNNRVGELQKKIEEKIMGDENDMSILGLRKMYTSVKKLEGDRKKINADGNKLKIALEDCIMGKGDFDAAQIEFDDLLADKDPELPPPDPDETATVKSKKKEATIPKNKKSD